MILLFVLNLKRFFKKVVKYSISLQLNGYLEEEIKTVQIVYEV